MNLTTLAEKFQHAVSEMEKAWVLLRVNRDCPRLMIRYVRNLRACGRLRAELDHLMKTGNL